MMIGFCAIRMALGFDCPGCGFVRSLFSLVQGNLKESIDYHPMGVVAVFLFLNFWWLRKISFSQRSRRLLGQVLLGGIFLPWFVKLFIY